MKSKMMPSILYDDCEKAIDWLCSAFGFDKHLIVPDETGGIAHAQLIYNDCMVMLGTLHERHDLGILNCSPRGIEGQNTASIYMVVETIDNHYQRAKKEGAEIGLDIKDEEYGGRGYTCKDIEGHLWSFGSYNPWEQA